MSRILLVDDSAVDRRLFGGILERQSGISVDYAASGLEALERLKGHRADVVITDMQMPDMDGLALVSAVRRDFPDIPVILMTAHGSESLAAQALQRGAASYVPKGQFNELLLDTVNEVLELARVDQPYQRLLRSAQSCELQFELGNESALDLSFIHLAQQFVCGVSNCDPTACVQVGVALEEAILNAVYHGNLELSADDLKVPRTEIRSLPIVCQRLGEAPFRDRNTHVRMRVTPAEAQFVVRDEGHGFDVKRQTKLALTRDHEEPAGRGFLLMWALMDKVTFNASGNQVTLLKRLENPAPATSPDERTVLAAARKNAGQLGEPAPAGQTSDAANTTLAADYGRLTPIDGGPPILLTKQRIVIGRDDVCDVVVHQSDVSRRHCLLFVYSGWWYVTDLGSSNGVQINGQRVPKGRLGPGATLAIGKNRYKLDYDLGKLGAVGITPPVDPF